MKLVEKGQTDNVIKLLVAWLQQAKIYLAEDQAVFGNVDTVSRLMDEHQVSAYLSLYLIITSVPPGYSLHHLG